MGSTRWRAAVAGGGRRSVAEAIRLGLVPARVLSLRLRRTVSQTCTAPDVYRVRQESARQRRRRCRCFTARCSVVPQHAQRMAPTATRGHPPFVWVSAPCVAHESGNPRPAPKPPGTTGAMRGARCRQRLDCTAPRSVIWRHAHRMTRLAACVHDGLILQSLRHSHAVRMTLLAACVRPLLCCTVDPTMPCYAYGGHPATLLTFPRPPFPATPHAWRNDGLDDHPHGRPLLVTTPSWLPHADNGVLLETSSSALFSAMHLVDQHWPVLANAGQCWANAARCSSSLVGTGRVEQTRNVHGALQTA